MSRLEFELTVRAVTPVYLAGADGRAPELREASFKGLLRFWYRAFDPHFQSHEAAIFGGAGPNLGQSSFALRLSRNGTRRPWSWNNALVGRFDEGRGRRTKNGIRYLANMAVPRRRAIAAGAEFKLHVLCLRPAVAPEHLRALLGSLWLLFHLGGAGSRSRRGFGSFTLQGWGPKDVSPEIGELPLLADCRSAAEAEDALCRVLDTLRSDRWPGHRKRQRKPAASRLNPHIGLGAKSAFRSVLHPDGFPADRPDAWADALNEAGRALQDFRLRRKPDYTDVKASLSRGTPLHRAPERATFGLPIVFRFHGIPGRAQFQAFRGTPGGGFTSDRHASLLFVRVLRIGDRLHPACFRLDGPVPADGPGSTSAAPARSHRPLAPPMRRALDDFMDAVARRWGVKR